MENLIRNLFYVSERDGMGVCLMKSDKTPPVIICHTEAHDAGNIYDRLLGIPKNAGTLPYGFVDKGTKIFVYYKYPIKGIKTIVRAKKPPYEDPTKIPEWSDEWPGEDYRHRIDTEPVARYQIPVLYEELVRMGVRRRDTGILFCTGHLRNTVVPIRYEDGVNIEAKLRQKNRMLT